MNKTFWSFFEEQASSHVEEENMQKTETNPTKTLTFTREETDQNHSTAAYNPLRPCVTKTATREEVDEAKSTLTQVSPMLVGKKDKLKTLTEAREEEHARASFKKITLGSRTLTRTREEADQDQSCVSSMTGIFAAKRRTVIKTDSREESDQSRSLFSVLRFN